MEKVHFSKDKGQLLKDLGSNFVFFENLGNLYWLHKSRSSCMQFLGWLLIITFYMTSLFHVIPINIVEVVRIFLISMSKQAAKNIL